MTERATGMQVMRIRTGNSIKSAFACMIGGAMYMLYDLKLILFPLADNAIYVTSCFKSLLRPICTSEHRLL